MSKQKNEHCEKGYSGSNGTQSPLSQIHKVVLLEVAKQLCRLIKHSCETFLLSQMLTLAEHSWAQACVEYAKQSPGGPRPHAGVSSVVTVGEMAASNASQNPVCVYMVSSSFFQSILKSTTSLNREGNKQQ